MSVTPNELLAMAKAKEEESRKAWLTFLKGCMVSDLDQYDWQDAMYALMACGLSMKDISEISLDSKVTVWRWSEGKARPGKFKKEKLLPLLITEIKRRESARTKEA